MQPDKGKLRQDYIHQLRLVARDAQGASIDYVSKLSFPAEGPDEKPSANNAFDIAFNQHWEKLNEGKYQSNDSQKLFNQFVYLFDAQIRKLLASDNTLARKWAEQYLVHYLSRYVNHWRIRFICRKEEDRKDCFTDAFVTLLRRISRHQYDPQKHAAIKTFFYKIFHDTCVDLRRKNTDKYKKHEVLWAEHDITVMQQLSKQSLQHIESLSQGLSMDTIREAIRQLSPNCQTIIETYYFRGFAMEAVSHRLEMAYDTAKQTKSRCMKKLRTLLMSAKKETHE